MDISSVVSETFNVERCRDLEIQVRGHSRSLKVPFDNNNNNNNNNHDDIYSAVIMTGVIARVHSVHLVNVEQRQAAADPQTKPPDLGCESACRLLSSTTTIAIYYYYSTRKLIFIYRPTEGRRLN